MGRDVVRLVALDLVSRVVLRGMMRVPLVIKITRVNFHDLPGHMAGFRIPAYMIANLELLRHLTHFSVRFESHAAVLVPPRPD